VLFSHPAVSEVAVIGKPDPEWGEIIKAFVVLKSGQKITEEETISFCNDKLATYKKPKEIAFVESLPHGPTGKVLRRELKMNEIAS
jgi:acyl-CoA synthetase (AMP-forming)/AMP-acid ligase II